MAGTRATSSDSDGESGRTTLAEAIGTDGPRYSRDCPHACHGELTVTEYNDEETTLCQTCRCSPDGTYHPPTRAGGPSVEGQCSGYLFFRPRGSRVVMDEQAFEHDTYSNSGQARLAGGYESVYDEDEDRRPSSVGDAYTFDLTTL